MVRKPASAPWTVFSITVAGSPLGIPGAEGQKQPAESLEGAGRAGLGLRRRLVGGPARAANPAAPGRKGRGRRRPPAPRALRRAARLDTLGFPVARVRPRSILRRERWSPGPAPRP